MIRAGYHPARVRLDARSRPVPAVPRCSTGRRRCAPLPRFSAALGGRAEVWIKREDLLPLAFGGNKLRNLEFLVGAALAEGADTLVTSGRRWSNHCPADRRGRGAGRARRPPRAVRPADRPARTRASRLDELLGATVHQARDRRPRRARGPRRAGRRPSSAAAGRRPYVVASAGSGVVGAVGQVLAGLRARRAGAARRASSRRPSSCRRRPAGPRPGSWSGCGPPALADARPRRRRHAARAELRPAIAATASPSSATLDGLAAVDRRARSSSTATSSATATAGRPRPPTRRPALLARTEGILVDPIYTAKALAGLVAAVRDGALDGRRSSSGTPAGRPACSSRSTDR